MPIWIETSRLINLGSNRWSFRPEVGVSRKQGRVFIELAAGAWLFTRNGDHYGATTLSQDPLLFAKGNLIYNFRRRGTWLSLNYGRATGGETTVGGVAKQDIRTNDRVGVTLALRAMVGFFRALAQATHSEEAVRLHQGAIRMGVALIVIGMVATLLAAFSHRSALGKLRRGEPLSVARWSSSLTIAVLVSVLGLYGLWSVLAP